MNILRISLIIKLLLLFSITTLCAQVENDSIVLRVQVGGKSYFPISEYYLNKREIAKRWGFKVVLDRSGASCLITRDTEKQRLANEERAKIPRGLLVEKFGESWSIDFEAEVRLASTYWSTDNNIFNAYSLNLYNKSRSYLLDDSKKEFTLKFNVDGTFVVKDAQGDKLINKGSYFVKEGKLNLKLERSLLFNYQYDYETDQVMLTLIE